MTTASDILNSLESALMALDPPHVRLVKGASDFVAVKNWLHDKRAEIADATPAPAPVRISPEVRETIRATLAAAHEHHLRWAKATPVHYDSYATNWFAVGKLDAAIAFVEALP